MHSILLEGTDCSKINFYNCTWPNIRGRWVAGDEYLEWNSQYPSTYQSDTYKCKKSVDSSRLAITYQQLAKNFREKFDHPKANDFDRGIFEMRRRAGFQRGGFRGLSNYALISCYKWLSNYSGSLLRPLLWLLVSIPLFAFAYLKISINSEVYKSFWNSLKLSVQIASLNRIGFETIRGDLIRVDVLAALQVVCTATLVALFLFAIRRRFKH